jgi:hypothetical protein
MTNYLTKYAIANAIYNCANEYPEFDGNINEIIEVFYDYAYRCVHKEIVFSEKESVKLVKAFIKNVDSELFRELWSILAMFSFENLANLFINQHVEESIREEAKAKAMGIIYKAGLKYNFKNDFRYLFELEDEPTTADLYPRAAKFITYASGALTHEIPYFIREYYYEIKTPDHEVFAMALINKFFEEYTNATGKEEYYINSTTLYNILQKQHKDRPKIKQLTEKKVNDLMWARIAVKSLHMTYGEANLPDTSYNLEDEVAEPFCEEKLYDVISEVYGENTAYVARLHLMKGLSFYKIEDMYKRYFLINKHLDFIASEDREAANCIDTIKRALRYGEKTAVKAFQDKYASRYLEAAIQETNTDIENIAMNKTTFEQLSGGKKFAAGSLNYMYNKPFPQHIPVGNDAKLHDAFKKKLCENNLNFIAYEFDRVFRS